MLIRRVAVATIASTLGFAPVSVTAAPNSQDGSKGSSKTPVRASLDIDAGRLGEDASALEQRVKTTVGGQLRKAEVLPRKELNDGLIHVEVTPLPSGEGYHYEVYAQRGDARLEGSLTSEDCVDCTEDALMERVSEAVDVCLPPLRATQPQSVQSSPPAQPPPPRIESPKAEDEGPSDRRRLGPKGKAGVGLLVGGGAVAVMGVLFVVQGRSYDTPPGALEQSGSNFRPPGFVMLGAGAAALIAGGVLVGLDRRSSRTQARVHVDPEFAGMTLRGRF